MGSKTNQNSDQVQTLNQDDKGVKMTAADFKLALREYYSSHVEETGKGGYTDFKKVIEACMKEVVKPLTVRAGMSAGGEGNWRDELKAQFKGRGRQWIWVAKESVQFTLDRLAGEGFDVVDYERWIATQENAWVRFTGPRTVSGVAMGAFEIRLEGSKVDCPKMLHYIPVDELAEENLNRMVGTPHSLGLEVDAPSVVATEDEVVEEVAMKEEVEETPVVEEEYVDVMDVIEEGDDLDEDLFGDF